MRSLLLALLLVGSLVAAPVPDEPVAPKGAAPTFLTLNSTSIDKNVLTVTSTRYVTVNEVVTEMVVIGGQNITRSRAVPKQVPQTQQAVYSLDTHEIRTAEGKALSTETAIPMLKATSVILLSDGPLDPAYARLLAKDTLILVKKK